MSGIENLRDVQGPVLFVANHQSYLDPATVLPRRWRYRTAPAMWMEFFDAHFFPEKHTRSEFWLNSALYFWVTVLFSAFPLSQSEHGTRQSLRYSGELIEDGWSVLIFPEGERSRTGALGTFLPGTALIASHMRTQVVPIHLTGFDRVLKKDLRWPRRGKVEVRLGKPFSIRGIEYATSTRQIRDAIASL